MPAALPYLAAAMVASSVWSSDQQRSSQNKAGDIAKANAKSAADQADQQMNAARKNTPDIGAMLSSNEQQAKGGISGTMLTGSSGVDPSTLQLGKTTLLGG